MEKSESIKEISVAFHKAQHELSNAVKCAENHYKGTYADLSEVLKCVKEVCFGNDLSFTQMPGRVIDGKVSLETLIIHTSGEFFLSTCETPVAKQDPHGIGGGITYLRRYSLASIFGVAQEDDDGNSNSVAETKNPQQRQPQQQAAPAHHRQSSQQDNDKPWFNKEELERDMDMMKTKITSGEATADQVIKNLAETYKISRDMQTRIKNLATS